MVPVTLLCLLLPLVQATLVSLSTKSHLGDPPYQIDSVDQYGTYTKMVSLSSDAKPLCSALRNDNTIVYGAVYATKESALNIVDLNTGKIQEGQRYSSYIFDNIAFDKVTNQTFVTSYSAGTPLFELLPNQTLRKIAGLIPSFSFAISSYSSSKHFFFLIDSGEGITELNVVSTVGAQAGQIIYDVRLEFLGVYNLAFDDTSGVLYAWGYDAFNPSFLVSLDYTTGKSLETIFLGYELLPSPSGSCISKDSILYSALWSTTYNASEFVFVDLTTGAARLSGTDRFATTLSFQ